MAATGYRNQSVCGTTARQYSMRTSMVRYLHGKVTRFTWVADMGVLKLPHLGLRCTGDPYAIVCVLY